MFFQLLLLNSFKILTWDYDIGGTRISWFSSLALFIPWFLGSKLKSRTDNKCTFEYRTFGGLAFCDCWETWSAWFPSTAAFTWRKKTRQGQSPCETVTATSAHFTCKCSLFFREDQEIPTNSTKTLHHFLTFTTPIFSTSQFLQIISTINKVNTN